MANDVNIVVFNERTRLPSQENMAAEEKDRKPTMQASSQLGSFLWSQRDTASRKLALMHSLHSRLSC